MADRFDRVRVIDKEVPSLSTPSSDVPLITRLRAAFPLGRRRDAGPAAPIFGQHRSRRTRSRTRPAQGDHVFSGIQPRRDRREYPARGGATARFSRPATIVHRSTSRSRHRPASPVRPFGASLLGLPSKSNSSNDSQTRYTASIGAALILPQWHHQRIGAVVSATTDQEVFCFVFNPFGATVDNFRRRGASMPRDSPIFGPMPYRHRHGLFRFR